MLAALLACLWLAAGASAAGPPVLGESWASGVLANSAKLSAQVNANGLSTSYHFDYIAKAGYEANLAAGKDGFSGAAKAPAGADPNLGSLEGVTVSQQLSGLQPGTSYHYRVVAKNSAGTAIGSAFAFATFALPGAALLPDGRGWEMVSPVGKNGGHVAAFGMLAGGGVLQAAADGSSVTYGSAASFGPEAQGAPPASQYVSSRTAAGWSTQNITVPLFSGSYGTEPDGVPYQLFSGDLARGLLLNGRHCRGEGSDCPVANPPLPGTEAPAGYQNYYLRQSAGPGFEALLRSSDIEDLDLAPAGFELSFAGASPDLRQVVLSTCAALTPNATEVPLGDGCDPAKPNLYLWSAGAGLELVNLLPLQSVGTPGAALAAPSGAVSADGSRVYWSDLGSGNLYLREGGQTRQVDDAPDVGGGGNFETASADGSIALFSKAGHLYRYVAAGDTSSDLTPGGGVAGVLGASADASRVYYLSGAGLFLRDGATVTEVAAAADPANYPPSTGSARVSADGAHLAFVSTVPLTGYDNTDQKTGLPDAAVYLYEAGADRLTCVSCSPTNGRPVGPSSLPGSTPNGQGPQATRSYKPRVLSADGRRLFFDSEDALALADTNNDADVYQWEAQGTGTCTRAGGCLALISSGRAEGGASFVDASTSGADVFFLTDGSLVGADPGAIDLYDARVGGGFPNPVVPIPCRGDACRSLPPEPVDPALSTLASGPGNPPVRYRKYQRRAHKKCRAHKRPARGRCAKKKSGAKGGSAGRGAGKTQAGRR